ncbi:hypothetical protein [Streptosporangium saharense]
MMMRSQGVPADGVLSYKRDHQDGFPLVAPRAIDHASAGADLAITS